MLSSSEKTTGSKRSRKPPLRLSWPASLGEEEVATNRSKRKRTRRNRTQPSDSELWVEKFAPAISAELCVAPRKVKECRAWLQMTTQKASNFQVPRQKLLVLVGSSGVGKSTMVRVLARELGLELHSWNESYAFRERGRTNSNGILEVDRSSALESFEEFLGRCGAGFSSLPLTSGPANTTKQSPKGYIVLLEDLPNLHGQDAAMRFRQIMSNHLAGAMVPSILIFSDVTEGKHKPADLERLIDPDILYSQSCMICLIHPVTKPKMKKILENIVHRQGVKIQSQVFEELHLQSGGDIRHAIMTLQLQSKGLNSMSSSPGQSTRQNDRDKKLSTFHALGKLLYAKRKIDEDGKQTLAFDPEDILSRSDLGVGGSLRFLEYHSPDFFTSVEDLSDAYSLFSDAAVLLDIPESYVRNGKSASLHLNTTKIILTQLLVPLSITTKIPFSPMGALLRSLGYVRLRNFGSCLAQRKLISFTLFCPFAKRSVAYANKNPAPNKFRQFSTPKVFEVIRKRRQNDGLVVDLARRLARSHLEPTSAIGNSIAFVTELLPSMRLIRPGGMCMSRVLCAPNAISRHHLIHCTLCSSRKHLCG